MNQIGMFSSLVVFLLFAQALAQDTNCDFSQNVNPGTTYRINSPVDLSNGNYRPGRQCRWLASAPVNYQLRLECTLEMPLTSGCSGDQLLISTTGDPTLTNAQKYCGRRTLTVISDGQKIGVGLVVSTSSSGGRFSCSLVAQQVQQPAGCVCGVIKSSRIVGGTAAGQHEFIWVVGLIDRGTNQIRCGGSIIANRYVLTAAHCVQGISTNDIIISAGDSNLQSGLRFSVSAIRIHPNYNSTTFDYDLALLLTTTIIPFSDFIGAICLPFRFGNADPTGATVTLLGWGTIFFGGPTSPNLMKTTSTIINQSECRRSLPELTNQQLCTRSPGRDGCQNDSGGPLVLLDSTTISAYILGIISIGVGCGSNFPSAHTRMQNFTNWIVNNAPANYCVKQ